MKKNAKQTALAILNIIGSENIIFYTNCLTRLRIGLNKDVSYDIEKLKQLKDVNEVVRVANSDEIQIVLTCGFVNEVKIALDQLLDYHNEKSQNHSNTQQQFLLSYNNKLNQTTSKSNYNWIQNFLVKFSTIFSPMIIGFIGAAILSSIASTIQSVYGGNINAANFNKTALSWYKALNLMLEIWKNAFVIIVGWRTCEVFGGSGVIGAMIATIYCPLFINKVLEIMIIDKTNNHVNFMGIKIKDPLHNWLTVGFHLELKDIRDESGGVKSLLTSNYPFSNIIGVLFSSACAIHLEKNLRKIKVETLSIVIVPTLTLFLLLIINFFLIMPISTYLYEFITWAFTYFYLNPFITFVLASLFLFAVSFGLHHGLIVVYSILVDQTGVNTFFAIFAMSGMAQVGSALAVWLLAEKQSVLRKQIQKTIIPAIFGIGEPILYTVILSRMRFFITTSFASGFAGLFTTLSFIWSNTIFGSNALFAPAGILTLLVITTPNGQIGLASIMYLIGCGVTLIAGIIITLLGYCRIVTAGLSAMNKLYCKNSVYKLWQQILLTISFISIIGLFVYWVYVYYKLSLDQRKKIAQTKVV